MDLEDDCGLSYRSQGYLRGLVAGREQGHKEGRSTLVLRMLARRFGELPPVAASRLSMVTIAELDKIGERLLTAESAEEALGSPGYMAGLVEGTAEGRREGRLSFVYRLLTHRFGELRPLELNYLLGVTYEELDQIGGRLLTAKSLKKALDSTPGSSAPRGRRRRQTESLSASPPPAE